MADSSDDVKVTFGASLDKLLAGIAQAGASVKEFSSKGSEQIESLNSSIAGLQKTFAALAELATLGFIGEAFVGLGVKTAEYAEELLHASQIAAVSAQDLAGLGFAAQSVGLDSDRMRQALVLLSRNMQNVDEEGGRVAQAFKAVGLSAQQVKSMTPEQVLMATANAFSRTQDSASKTAVAMALFGRSGAQLIPLLDQGSSGIGALMDKAKEFGIVLDGETNAAAIELADKLTEVHAAAQGLQLTIGAQLLPYLLQISNAFVDAAKDGQTFKVAGDAIGTVLKYVAVAASYVLYALSDTGDELGALAAYADRLAHLDIAGAQAVAAAREDESSRNDAAIKKMVDSLLGYEGALRSASAAEDDFDKARDASHAGDNTIPFDPNAEAKKKKAQALAEAMQALQKATQQASLSLQLEYEKEDLASLEDSYTNNLITTKGYYDAKLAIELEGVDASIAAKQKELDAAKKTTASSATPDAMVKSRAKEVELAGQINLLEAQRTGLITASTAALTNAEQKRVDEMSTIAEQGAKEAVDSKVAAERGGIAQMQALRQIDNTQAIAMQKQLEAELYASVQEGLDQRQTLVHGDAAKQATLDNDRVAAYNAYQQKLTDLDHQAEQIRLAYAVQAQQGMENSFAGLLTSLSSRTNTLRQDLLNFGQSVGKMFEDLIAKKFAEKLFGAGTSGGGLISALTQPIFNAIDSITAQWAIGQGQLTSATAAGTAARAALEDSAASASLALQVGTIIKNIMNYAAQTFAGVFAFLSPTMGPWAAVPAAAASVLVSGEASVLSSAAGGWWDIPTDQLAQVHKNEMVIPQGPAAGLRSLIEGGGGNSNGGGGDTHNWNIQTPNPKAFAQWLNDGGGDMVADFMAKKARRFGGPR